MRETVTHSQRLSISLRYFATESNGIRAEKFPFHRQTATQQVQLNTFLDTQ
jgi:hypothetical protein